MVQDSHCGRTLEATPVYRVKNQLAPLVKVLWPDSITIIYESDQDWYQVQDGFAPRTMVQPMISYDPSISMALPLIPFWADVAAPVAPVRQWGAADAPPVTRIGHGGIARVIDYLPGDEISAGWYGLDNGCGNFLGWTQAVYWRPVQEELLAAIHPTLHIDRNDQVLTAYDEGEEVLQAPVSIGMEIAAGAYMASGRQFSGAPVFIPGRTQAIYGVPWRVQFGENYELSGAYWHNRFGESMPGPAVQVTPLLARWLYHWLGERGIIIVT